jgi:hypothetical protein
MAATLPPPPHARRTTQPSITGFLNSSSNTSSGLTLLGGGSGTAQWLIVPRDAAALGQPTTYYVGGTVRWVGCREHAAQVRKSRQTSIKLHKCQAERVAGRQEDWRTIR